LFLTFVHVEIDFCKEVWYILS